MTDDGKKVDRR